MGAVAPVIAMRLASAALGPLKKIPRVLWGDDMKTMRIMAIAAATFCAAGAVQAQEPLKIGMITTLSGPAGYLGLDIRDAFQLAIDM